ncbi:MAG: porin family protein [Alphaproteobacteria bacterium]|nr:MAG: porin family protein [Alphaproteobacteria bacterium]
MSRAKTLGLAGVAALLSTASFAADLPPLPPPVYRAPVVETTGGWYLRGFIGASNEFLKEISHPDFLTAPQFVFIDKGGFDAAPFGGGGVGYQWNNWFRVDATIEYRGKANFHALDRFFNPFQFTALPNGAFNTNQYTASKSELVGLENAYLDLGTWWCVTPFIGAGAGFASIKIDHFRDVNVIAAGGGFADTGTQTNFAWALHAGVAYKVNPNFAVELSYRYLNVGNAQSGTLLNLDPTVSPTTFAPMTFHNIQSHDIMLGVRWMLQQEAPAPMYAPPLMRKG